MCFRGHNENTPTRLAQDAKQLIERCRTKDPKRRPTMEDVVKEMETWSLT
jgi:serine/threonine protein kinase